MGLAGAVFALTAAQAVSQISQGYAQRSEANYNATLLEGKANIIGAQEEIDSGRYDRMKGQYLSKSIANVAGAGIKPTGSALAVMVDTQAQINIDQAISKFNYEQEKNYTTNQADAMRRSGSAAVRSGYSNAFSSLLSGATNYAMYKYKPSSFDYNTASPKRSFGG